MLNNFNKEILHIVANQVIWGCDCPIVHFIGHMVTRNKINLYYRLS